MSHLERIAKGVTYDSNNETYHHNLYVYARRDNGRLKYRLERGTYDSWVCHKWNRKKRIWEKQSDRIRDGIILGLFPHWTP